MSDLPAPGWYPDPADPSTQRYWAGDEWIGDAIPVDATPPAEPPTKPVPAAEPAPAAGEKAAGEKAPDEKPASAIGTPAPAGATGPNIVRLPGSATAIAIDPTKVAPLGARFAARLIDIVAVFVLNVVVNGYFAIQYYREVGPTTNAWADAFMRGEQQAIPELSSEARQLVWVMLLISMALWFAYEVPASANSGQTLGKRLMGLRVARLADGKSLTFGQSMRRWILLALPSPLFASIFCLPVQLIDLLWCVWDRPARQCLHDKFVTTIVVTADAVPEKKDEPDRVHSGER